MRDSSRMVWIGLLVAVGLAGCARPPAAEVAFAEVCDPANDGQRIAAVGYFAAGVTVFCSDIGGDYRCGMDFVDAPGSENRFTADVLEGRQANRLLPVPDSYTDADIQLKTADGGTLGVGQLARISGEMLIGEGVCLMSVDTIEAATD